MSRRESDPLRRKGIMITALRRRINRRVDAVVTYITANPASTRNGDPTLRRLDDLLGQADALWKRL